tara:strand:+ start:1035 stop:1235 length:201 start_codon:yes stop_codon:yes gene_type:complete
MDIKTKLNKELNKVFDDSFQWVYDMEDEADEEWQGYLAETEAQGYSLKVIFLTLYDGGDYMWRNSD